MFIIITVDIAAVLIWLWVLGRFERYSVFKRHRHVLWLFFLAGIISVPLVFLIYSIWGNLEFFFSKTPVVISDFYHQLLIVGPVEEAAKFIVFFGIAGLLKTVKEPRDGMLQAMSVALAFAAVENYYYALEYGTEVLLRRSVIAILGHMSLAGIWAYLAGVYLYTRQSGSRRFPYSLMLCAGLHGFHNFFLYFDTSLLSRGVDILSLGIAVSALLYLRKKSPFHIFPLDRWREAADFIEEALRVDPKNFLLHKRAALYYLYGGKLEKAHQHLKTASELSPSDYSVSLYCAAVSYLEGRIADAVVEFNALASLVFPDGIVRFRLRLEKLLSGYKEGEKLLALLRELEREGRLSPETIESAG
jgi:RsiW-degrading membrane proteinase PrsW (M82 family)